MFTNIVYLILPFFISTILFIYIKYNKKLNWFKTILIILILQILFILLTSIYIILVDNNIDKLYTEIIIENNDPVNDSNVIIYEYYNNIYRNQPPNYIHLIYIIYFIIFSFVSIIIDIIKYFKK
jgi:hypothetical protein